MLSLPTSLSFILLLVTIRKVSLSVKRLILRVCIVAARGILSIYWSKCFLSHSVLSIIFKLIPKLIDFPRVISLPSPPKTLVLSEISTGSPAPVRVKILIIVLSRLILGMIFSDFFRVTLIPIQPLPVFSKLIVQFHVPFAPRFMLRFLNNEASAAHELFPELLTTLVRDVVSGDDEALTWGHMIADLMHLAVHDPPLRYVSGFVEGEPRTRGLGAPLGGSGVGSSEAELVGGGAEALG